LVNGGRDTVEQSHVKFSREGGLLLSKIFLCGDKVREGSMLVGVFMEETTPTC
jgi:hypothetical protein